MIYNIDVVFFKGQWMAASANSPYLSVLHAWYIFLYCMYGISFCTTCMVYLSVLHAWYIYLYCMNRLNQWHYLHYIYVQFLLHVLDYTNSSILSSWHSSNQQSSAMCLNYITNYVSQLSVDNGYRTMDSIMDKFCNDSNLFDWLLPLD